VVLGLAALSGFASAMIGVLLLTAVATGDRRFDLVSGGPVGTLLFLLTLIAAFPFALLAWGLSRKGRDLEGALVLLAAPLGAVVWTGLEPRLLESVGTTLAPFFLGALILSLGRGWRSLAVSALAVLGCGAIWSGALLPGEFEARLREAARAGDERRVERLLGWRVDPDGRDERGVTALMLAVEADDEVAVRTLVQHGADPDLADRSGRSAKMRAIEGRRSALTLLFLGFAGGDAGDPERPAPAPGAEP
jgi:hypothetical protein